MELTHLLVVHDVERSRAFYPDVVGAEEYRTYDGTSVVLRLLGTWLLVVSGCAPTADKPGVAFAPPRDVQTVSHEMTIRVRTAAPRTRRSARGAPTCSRHRSRTTRKRGASSAIPTDICLRSASRDHVETLPTELGLAWRATLRIDTLRVPTPGGGGAPFVER
jgi:hypothetical protein